MIHHEVLVLLLSLVFAVQSGSSNDSVLGDAPDPGPKNCCWTCYGTVHIMDSKLVFIHGWFGSEICACYSAQTTHRLKYGFCKILLLYM